MATILELDVLLHYAQQPHEHPGVGTAKPVDAAMDKLIGDGIFAQVQPMPQVPMMPGGERYKTATVKLTDKGRAWLAMLQLTPYPRMSWIDPRTDNPVLPPKLD